MVFFMALLITCHHNILSQNGFFLLFITGVGKTDCFQSVLLEMGDCTESKGSLAFCAKLLADQATWTDTGQQTCHPGPKTGLFLYDPPLQCCLPKPHAAVQPL
jgi:hypothetical protein